MYSSPPLTLTLGKPHQQHGDAANHRAQYAEHGAQHQQRFAQARLLRHQAPRCVVMPFANTARATGASNTHNHGPGTGRSAVQWVHGRVQQQRGIGIRANVVGGRRGRRCRCRRRRAVVHHADVTVAIVAVRWWFDEWAHDWCVCVCVSQFSQCRYLQVGCLFNRTDTHTLAPLTPAH